jgi:hypothetical protein
LRTGKLSWTPSNADAPAGNVTLRLLNDSGETSKSFAIDVLGGDGGTESGADASRADGDLGDAAPVLTARSVSVFHRRQGPR